MTGHIYLIGFMGTGKSTVSKALSQLLNTNEIEMDQELAKLFGMSIPAVFETKGEEAFREMESAYISSLSHQDAAVVSCGGGAVLRGENVSCMKQSGTIVLLTARPETVYERVRANTDRPLLNGRMSVEGIAELMEKRQKIYAAACDFSVITDERSPEDIAREIAEKIQTK